MNWLLISDLDSTWVGDQIALEKLQQQLSDRRDSLYLVYATGRSFASAKALQQEVGLMEPNYWVTAVGSEIYHADGLDLAWADYLSENWQRDTIQAIADQEGLLFADQAKENRLVDQIVYWDQALE